MVEGGPHACALYDAELRLSALSSRAAELYVALFGVPPVVGESLLDRVPAERLDTVWSWVESARRGESVRVERTWRGRDGEVHVYEMNVAPMPGERPGSFMGLCMTLWPVDERRLAIEATLREREEQLRVAMEAGRIVPWQWDVRRDHVERALDIAVGGRPPVDMESFFAGIHPEDRPVVRAALRDTLERDAPYQIQYRKVVERGVRWLDARAALVRDEHGRPARLVGVAVDVTERRKLEDRLVQSQKMEAVGRLAGGVSHDFNNLLTVITTAAQLLRRRLGERPEVRDILDAAERAGRLTQQLLTFSRRQLLRPATLDLGQVVEGMLGMLDRMIGEDLELEAALGGELSPVRADPTQVEQVIMNLVVNARDAMPRGGRVRLELDDVELGDELAAAVGIVAGRYVRLRVSDTGVGIDERTRPHLFEPFFSTKGPGAGSGLGLATVYGIVTQLGGGISVESAPNEGATFDVFFPAEVGHAQPSAQRIEAVAGSLAGHETILLVEDEPSLRRVTREVLELHGYRVLEADDGESAVELARTYPEPIELLVSDVIMRRMGGVAAARLVAEARPDIRVLFVTGYADDALVRHGMVGGELRLLRKPFTPDLLARTVREVLESR
jgi:two-component system cell cycle sensor histidine kinase/response regulator CckA